MDLRNTFRAVPLGTGPTDRPALSGRDAPDYDNVLNCIRCGLCLSVCPTYNVELAEAQSPRGRVALLRAADERRLPLSSETLKAHMYHCLDCRACQTICPSGVRVGELVLMGRAQAERHVLPSFKEWAVKQVAFHLVLVSAARLRLFTWPIWLYQASGLQAVVRATRLLHRLPGGLRLLGSMEELLPPIPRIPLHEDLPELVPATGVRKHRVGFFLGCMMSVLLRETSAATVRSLTRNGCDVVTPKGQLCCGAPHIEEGDPTSQRRFARHNVELFADKGLEYIVTDCAACGAELKGYGRLLADEPRYAKRAAEFSSRVRDITELLVEIGARPPEGRVDARVTYDEPCHLCHAQGIRRQPRQVIQMVPGVHLVELEESEWCCGSAGVYNVTHAARAEQILDRKIEKVAETQASILATGNPGCLLQLRAGVRRAGLKMEVIHPVQILDRAYNKEVHGAGGAESAERAPDE